MRPGPVLTFQERSQQQVSERMDSCSARQEGEYGGVVS
jgi:hypothetical protein